MNADALRPASLAVFLVATFLVAGAAQVAWLAAPFARRFAVPLDGGLTLRGRRLFGDNKTLKGFLVMVPAAGASFVLCSLIARAWGLDAGLWRLSAGGYAVLGLIAGFGFMAGELPNSFVKRQLDIAPGQPAAGATKRRIFAVIDRLDSAAGLMFALWLVVPVPWITFVYVALIGPGLHALFSFLAFRFGGKARAG